MLGYLNAAAPFTADGWFITGDRVETDGDYIRILGRDSEIINVGGEKVYPVEVESVIQELEEVQEVTVYGERNPITGHIVCARIRPYPGRAANPREFSTALKQHCRQRLQRYKVPVKVMISEDAQHNARLKKNRKAIV
jgi:acyl-CoA synthetase (AMP-forming)/AMP-acid ligase II